MMSKSIVSIFLWVGMAQQVYGDINCSQDVPDIPKEWLDMDEECVAGMRKQIQKEINASYQYLAMGAFFARETVNRPGVSEYFFKAAKQEREHARKLIEYLSMRGPLTDNIRNLIHVPPVFRHEWKSGASAFEDALQLEIRMTKSIRKLIATCRSKPHSHYHLLDYLSGVYMADQLTDQRELAGNIVTLKKMIGTYHELGEFLFDKAIIFC